MLRLALDLKSHATKLGNAEALASIDAFIASLEAWHDDDDGPIQNSMYVYYENLVFTLSDPKFKKAVGREIFVKTLVEFFFHFLTLM